VIPEGFESSHAGKTKRPWFPTIELSDDNRPQRASRAVPALEDFIRQQQQCFGILQSDTTLAWFC
jgi:phospholipase/carboxylesterase